MARIVVTALAAVFLVAGLALAQPADRLVSFDKLLELLQQQVPEADIRTKLADSPTTFTLSPAQVRQLKDAGATDELLAALTTPPSTADEVIGSYVLILDCSNSMREIVENGQTKFEFARKAALDLVAAMPDGKELGVIVYGYNADLACKAVSSLRPMGPLEPKGRAELVATLNKLQPAGHTPIAGSLKVAARHLEKATSAAKIILITDGIETCHGKPDEEAANLVKAFPQLRGGVNVIGFGLKPEEVRAVGAIAAGGGQFYDARNPKDLIKAVKKVEVTLAKAQPALEPEAIAEVAPPAPTELPVIETAEVPASKVKASTNPQAPAPLELGSYVSGRLDDSRKSKKYHYWLVDVPAGDYKLFLDYKRADGVDSNLQAELHWMKPDGTLGDRIGDINQIDVRGREIFHLSFDMPQRAVFRFENSQTIADYQLALFHETDAVPGPFFMKNPKVYQLELGKPVTFQVPAKKTLQNKYGYYSLLLSEGDFRVTATGYGRAKSFRHLKVDIRTLEGGEMKPPLHQREHGPRRPDVPGSRQAIDGRGTADGLRDQDGR